MLLLDIGLTNVLWFNMRSEPVIYVNNMSYSPRDPSHPSENIHLSRDITIDDVNELSNALAKIVKENAEKNKNIFVYHKDTYALLPEDRIDETLEEKLDDKKYKPPVKSLLELYETYLPQFFETKYTQSNKNENENKSNGNGNKNGNDNFVVHCERLPINDERAPDSKDIDRLVSLLLIHSNPKTAIVFNCQMGKGRTTEGMIMAALVKKNCNEYYENLEKTMLDTLSKKNNNNSENKNENENVIYWAINKPEISAEASKDNKKFCNSKEILELIKKYGENCYNGNYRIINNLIELLTKKYNLNGKLIKKETDDIIDACQHLQNLRRCIFSTKLRYSYEMIESDSSSNKNKELGFNFVCLFGRVSFVVSLFLYHLLLWFD